MTNKTAQDTEQSSAPSLKPAARVLQRCVRPGRLRHDPLGLSQQSHISHKRTVKIERDDRLDDDILIAVLRSQPEIEETFFS